MQEKTSAQARLRVITFQFSTVLPLGDGVGEGHGQRRLYLSPTGADLRGLLRTDHSRLWNRVRRGVEVAGDSRGPVIQLYHHAVAAAATASGQPPALVEALLGGGR
jgi:hypothetical protein